MIIVKKYIFSILSAIVIGLAFGKFMLKQYQNPKNIIPVMSSPFKVFFLELGVYDSEVEMKESTIKFPFYIYTLKDNKYYVYIGITKNENNLNKIKGYYENKGYIISVREYEIENDAFLAVLEQYDNLLLESTDDEVIDGVCSQVLSKYEEMVLKNV